MKSNSDNNTSEAEIPFSDIAILELRKPIDLGDKDLRPICLPNPLKSYPKHFIEFGFGYTNVEEWQRGDVGNMQLKWFTTEIDSFCNRSRKFTYLNLDCNRTIFSFRDTIGSEIGVCKGDSGGGLSSVVNGRHTLFGVLSLANKRCNEPPNFEIFTSTTAYHDFICYYTGVCPMGFNRYVDHAYARHPESVISDSSDAEMFVTIAKNRQSSVRQTMQLWCLLVCQMLITRALRYL
ncbi:Coagulation factor IX [Toxocara canis]|uniref:Coagulation factor IX n=1 Tax=Toxocara canis TaxID=6265 RepID=A0A0B2V029_TOXCA|nr:Coagulation factor IX [Toxocara canis]